MYLLVFKQLLIMLIIAASSFAVTKIFKFGKNEQQFMSKMLLLYINPCLILSHFDIEFDIEKLKNFAIVALIAIISHFLMILIAAIFARSKDEEGKSLDCIDKLSIVLTNCGFIGIPLIEGVLGGEGVFYLLAYIATFNVFTWTYGFYQMAGKTNFKKIITNPNIICVIAGLLIFALPIRLPEIIAKPIKIIGSMNTACAMILLGMLFATFQKKEAGENSYTKRIVKVSLIKYIVISAIMFPVIFLISKVFQNVKDIKTMCYVIYIACLCPTAMSVSSMAVIFQKDQSYSALINMVTSALCVIFLPLCVGLLELAIK